MRVWLLTNGQFPQQIEIIYRDFSDIIDSFGFSIDGATRKTYEMIRQGASFDKLIESLETVHRLNAGKREYRVGLSIDSILVMSNVMEVPAYFDLYSKYCYPEKINFSLINSLSPDSSFFKEESSFPHLIQWSVPCPMIFNEIYFTYDGQATLCCRDYNGELIVGDIRNNTIMELWNGSHAETIRHKHLNPNNMDIESCKSCLGPSPAICDIVNEYIHFLVAHKKGLTPKQFSDRILHLLRTMDSVIVENNLNTFRESVLPLFK
jgi:radical SAM protein with 4Fe4S-binding SPASM domain